MKLRLNTLRLSSCEMPVNHKTVTWVELKLSPLSPTGSRRDIPTREHKKTKENNNGTNYVKKWGNSD